MAYNDLIKSRRCSHVHFSGKPCRAPARRNRPYCLFHESAHLDPGDRPLLPVPEDEQSLAIAVMRIVRALTEGNMEPKRAAIALYGLQLISGNVKRFVASRAEIEDPDSTLARNMYARYLVHRHHAIREGKKQVEPTAEESDQMLREATEKLAASRAHPDAPTPDPMVRQADEDLAQDIELARRLARSRAEHDAQANAALVSPLPNLKSAVDPRPSFCESPFQVSPTPAVPGRKPSSQDHESLTKNCEAETRTLRNT